jgi:proline iminopeptidase
LSTLLTAATEPVFDDAKAVAGGAGPSSPVLSPGEHTVQINGLKLWYKVSGRGPVCVMPTPGWGPPSDLYFNTFGPLEDLFTIVYFDTRGTGRSERPKTTMDYTWNQFTADLEALRGHLRQPKVWVMSHSWGGVHAMRYALKHPDRVIGLILLDSLPASDQARRDDIMARAKKHENEPWYEKAVKARETSPTNAEEGLKHFEAILPLYFSNQANIARLWEHFDASVVSYHAMQGSADSGQAPFSLVDRLKDIRCPTLIVVGADEITTSPAQAQRLHLGIPNSKFLLIENAAHFPWLEQPDAFFSGVRSFLPALGYEHRIAPAGDGS